MGKTPVILPTSHSSLPTINTLVEQSISLSRADWDSFETSWDFKKHPLIRGVGCVEEAFAQWQAECSDRFHQLKANEEELNRIFIDIYGLQDELTPEVEDKDVTVRKADLQREIKSLISYAVGCMFGRYSLDVDGLAYAGGEWDSSKYVTFQPDKDGILPITDDDGILPNMSRSSRTKTAFFRLQTMNILRTILSRCSSDLLKRSTVGKRWKKT